jgi:hypothetical protein
MLPVGRVPITTPPQDAAAGARLFQAEGWTANRLLTPRLPLPMHSKSFTGFSAASIDALDATSDASSPISSFTRRRRGWAVPALLRKDGGVSHRDAERPGGAAVYQNGDRWP